MHDCTPLYLSLLPAPLQSWGPSFSYSVWYVELHGVMEEARVGEARRGYEEVRGEEGEDVKS